MCAAGTSRWAAGADPCSLGSAISRKELTSPPTAPTGQHDGTRMEYLEEAPQSDVSSHNSQGVEAVEDLKMNDQCGNVIENKGPLWKTGGEAGMSMKTKALSS